MREILFRGKRTDNKEWVYGSLVTMDDKYSYGDTNIFSNLHIIELQEKGMRHFSKGCGLLTDNSVIQIHEKTIGQYTGIKDKNGVKIFEGDVIRYNEEGFIFIAGHVIYKDCSFFVKGTSEIWGDCRIHHLEGDITMEVIGNIHDNPELIKQ